MLFFLINQNILYASFNCWTPHAEFRNNAGQSYSQKIKRQLNSKCDLSKPFSTAVGYAAMTNRKGEAQMDGTLLCCHLKEED